VEKNYFKGGYARLKEGKMDYTFPCKVRWSMQELQNMSVFEAITGVMPIDCVLLFDQPIFLVPAGSREKALGKYGINLYKLGKVLGNKPLIIEFHADPKKFISKFIQEPAKVEVNGNIAVISSNPHTKPKIIGSNGKKINLLRFLVKRYFQISTVKVI